MGLVGYAVEGGNYLALTYLLDYYPETTRAEISQLVLTYQSMSDFRVLALLLQQPSFRYNREQWGAYIREAMLAGRSVKLIGALIEAPITTWEAAELQRWSRELEKLIIARGTEAPKSWAGVSKYFQLKLGSQAVTGIQILNNATSAYYANRSRQQQAYSNRSNQHGDLTNMVI